MNKLRRFYFLAYISAKFQNIAMKKIILLLSLSFFLNSCYDTKTKKDTQQTTNTNNADTQITKVGGDKDSHGCIASAGYEWSEIRKECIRIFETGIRLNAKGAGIDTTTSAFAVFNTNPDSAQVELFLVNVRNTIILNGVKDDKLKIWKNNDYTLTTTKGVYNLEDAKKNLLYQSRIK